MPARFPTDSAVIALAKPLIVQFEGYSATPYLCPAGKPTIAWGCTRYPSGKPVTMGDYPEGISDSFAGICVVSAMLRVIAGLEACLTRTPTVHQAAALVCLAYNIGVGLHDGIKGDLADSTLLAKFNADDIASAADQFLAWDKAHINGALTELPGLKRRREAERAMFLTADT